MESRDHFKNAANSKSLTSRGNLLQRIFLLFAVFWISVVSAFAQDLIKLKNGRDIKALIQETGNDDVKFKKYDNSDGTVYMLKKYEIATIMYADGRKEDYSKVVPPKLPKRYPWRLNLKYNAMTRKFLQDLENRMNICGFTERVVVYDILSDEDKKKYAYSLSDIGWCTVGIWLNRQERLVALRINYNNWNEIIVPYDKIQSVESTVYGYSKTGGLGVDLGGIAVFGAKTRERMQGLRIRIVTGNINTGSKAYNMIIYDKYPTIYLDGTEDLYDSFIECGKTIEDELGLMMRNY